MSPRDGNPVAALEPHRRMGERNLLHLFCLLLSGCCGEEDLLCEHWARSVLFLLCILLIHVEVMRDILRSRFIPERLLIGRWCNLWV